MYQVLTTIDYPHPDDCHLQLALVGHMEEREFKTILWNRQSGGYSTRCYSVTEKKARAQFAQASINLMQHHLDGTKPEYAPFSCNFTEEREAWREKVRTLQHTLRVGDLFTGHHIHEHLAT